MGTIQLSHFLLVAAALFATGLYGVLTRRNAIAVLMSLELMFNAVNINLIAFARFLPHLDGVVLSVFCLAIAAAESAVGVALVLSIYRNFRHIDVDQVDTMKG